MTQLFAVDVSHWQGAMDWKRTKSAGVQFAFIKATEGLIYTDPQLKANVSGARSVDIPFGIYHYWRSLVSPILQCDNIMKAYESIDIGDTIPIALDVESYDGLTSKQNKSLLIQLTQCLIERTSKIPTMYTRKTAWDGLVEEYSRWSEMPLWVANYGVTSPALPRDWNDWMVWQYSSTGSGAKYGAESTNIDLDYVKPAYLEYYGIGTQPEPEPQPEPVEHDITITLDGVTYSGKVR